MPKKSQTEKHEAEVYVDVLSAMRTIRENFKRDGTKLIEPLEYCLRVVADDSLDPALRSATAIKLLPFLHANVATKVREKLGGELFSGPTMVVVRQYLDKRTALPAPANQAAPFLDTEAHQTNNTPARPEMPRPAPRQHPVFEMQTRSEGPARMVEVEQPLRTGFYEMQNVNGVEQLVEVRSLSRELRPGTPPAPRVITEE